MPKIKTKEDIEDEMKSLARQRDELIVKANDLQNKLIGLEEMFLSMDKSFVKVECFNPGCFGTGYIRGEDKKLRECQLCSGKGYKWMKIYTPKKEEPKDD